MRIVSLDAVSDRLRALPRAGRVYIGGYTNHPAALASALVRAVRPDHALEVVCPAPIGCRTELAMWPGRAAGRLLLPQVSKAFEGGMADGWASYWPVHLSDLARRLEDPRSRLDVALVQVAPPDADGRCHLGLSVDVNANAASNADVVIAQLNPGLPRAMGEAWIDVGRIDIAVAAEEPLQVLPRSEPVQAERQVARRVAALIPDQATVQLGIGRLMDAVADALAGHRTLTFHTGLLTDGIARLLAAGEQACGVHRVVATMVAGGAGALAAVREDPRVELRPVSHTHSPTVLAGLPALHAVNTCLEIDLEGNIGAECVDGRLVAAIGGAADFARGARASRGGCSILALTSRTPDGRSRIVTRLSGPISLPRADTSWVVTEYGGVDLAPLPMAERARALADLAHPDVRPALLSTDGAPQ